MRFDRRHRRTAADWHGGQWSGLYAYASTGTVTYAALREAEREAANADPEGLEPGTLRDLIDLVWYLRGRLPDEPGDE